jgi:light-regulated signal transduction histidine kinase (bacteriophytochrome)
LQPLDAIGQITSGVAHDFNNLLSVALTNARLLSHSLREPGDQEEIEMIRTAAERGVKLVGQLLAFSRRQRLEPQEVDLNSKIAGMSRLFNATLEGTVQLRTVLAPDLRSAQVDATQVELVILNLAAVIIHDQDSCRRIYSWPETGDRQLVVIDPRYFDVGQEHFDRGTLADACLDSNTSARLLRETDHLSEAEAGVVVKKGSKASGGHRPEYLSPYR